MISLWIFQSICWICMLLLISYIDCTRRIIPNKLLIGMVILRFAFLAYHSFSSGINPIILLFPSLVAVLLTAAVTALLLPFLHRKTGAGDFKLLLACAFCFGLDLYLRVLLIALVLLALFLVAQLITKQKKNIPFAPFICAGMLIASLLSHN